MPTQEEFDKLVAEHAALGKRFDAYIADRGKTDEVVRAKHHADHHAAMERYRQAVHDEFRTAANAANAKRDQEHASEIAKLNAALVSAQVKLAEHVVS